MNSENIDYTKLAAGHLRDVAKVDLGSKIGSGHAHMLVAAAFGYLSRTAMLRDPGGFSVDDQRLHQKELSVDKITDALARMEAPPVPAERAARIALIIQDGLTPECVECGTHSALNVPVGAVDKSESTEDWVCRDCSTDEEEFGYCQLCGVTILFRLETLDQNGLCEEHRGEFEMDENEEEDLASFAEYQLNHD